MVRVLRTDSPSYVDRMERRHPEGTVLSRLCALGAVVGLGGFLVIGACLFWTDPGGLADHWSSLTIYPWWTLVLVGAGLVASTVALLSRTASRARCASGVAGVVAAELSGLGIVASQHWQPSFGMGGGYAGDVRELERLALSIGVTGALVALVSLGQVLLLRSEPASVSRRARRTATLVGAGMVVVVPPAIGIGAGEDRDLTSLVAYALIYSAPWGLAVIVTGWLDRLTATAVLVTCSTCALLVAVGPQMTDLVVGEARPALLLAAAAPAYVLWTRRPSAGAEARERPPRSAGGPPPRGLTRT